MITLVGSTGYIGRAFKAELEKRGLPHGCFPHNHVNIREIHSAELVINCAAFIPPTSVDDCEDRKADTISGNLVYPSILSTLCSQRGVPFMQISTGCLYNGDKGGTGFNEEDTPHLSFDSGAGVYVGSKQLAERIAMQYAKTYSLRIRLPFDEEDHHRNYLSKLQTYPKVYSNLNSLTHRKDFAQAALDLYEKKAPYGIYHMTNSGAMTARQICVLIQGILDPNRQFDFWEEEEFMKTCARTKKSNCVLDTSKAAGVGVVMRPVEEAVVDSLENWVSASK